jgi:uncharacterized membrane protein (DUF106 family)
MEYDVVNADNQGELIDESKLQRLKTRVYMMERENYKTKKLKDNEMVEKIIKLIIQEVENVN